MIKVIIKCPVFADQTARFIELGSQLAGLAKTEPGCVSYQIAQDLQDATQVILVEEWENGDVLGAHMAKPYFKEISDQMVALQSGDPDIRVCNIVG